MITELLAKAFAIGDAMCMSNVGYTFKVTMKSGVVFEGAPEDTRDTNLYRHVLILQPDKLLLLEEIAAIQVEEF